MDLYPSATFSQSPNCWTGRNGYSPLAIVCHIEDGTEAGTDAWFSNPASQVSAHFSIDKGGTVRQHVKLGDSAWANGIIETGNTIPASFPSVNPNYWTVSIEHEGKPGDVFPDAQYQASRKLIGWLCDEFGIPKDTAHIFGHNVISPQSRANCPGPSFPWAKLFADLTAPPPSSALADADFRAYAPKTGTWREACANLLGVANDALAAGRANRDLATKIVENWGKR